MSQSKKVSVTISAPNLDDENIIAIPRRIRVRKEGMLSRVFCADTGKELIPVSKVKADLSNGVGGKVKLTLTLECDLTEVVFVDQQIDMFPDKH